MERKKYTVTLDLTEEQAVAVREMFAYWNYCCLTQTDTVVGFSVEGKSKNFIPNAEFKSEVELPKSDEELRYRVQRSTPEVEIFSTTHVHSWLKAKHKEAELVEESTVHGLIRLSDRDYSKPRWDKSDAVVPSLGGHTTWLNTCSYCGSLHPGQLLQLYKEEKVKLTMPARIISDRIDKVYIGVESKSNLLFYLEHIKDLRSETDQLSLWGFINESIVR